MNIHRETVQSIRDDVNQAIDGKGDWRAALEYARDALDELLDD